ncbi:hypothetical protein EUTSA_v10019434mg [Eutrema salsugineum]|uniref:DUF4408 domain-containing protein n=2 Tax=Eutrema salsugineum TaxID=72664 RepID=V4KK20_EUTSA|nr:hypothetical protein EUTSA_v10019434mg [Eutrema salsugineum]
MTKPFEFHGVEAEKAEAMRRYNNRRRFRNILRSAAVASFCYMWFPTVAISLRAAGDWFHRTGAVIVTNRSVVFVFANIIVALIFLLSRERDDERSTVSTEPDLYDQYTSSSAVIVTASGEDVEDDDSNDERSTIVSTDQPEQHASDENDDSNKQIVPALFTEVPAEADREALTTECKGVYRRTKSKTKKENIRPVTEFRRTESAIERLSSEEFRLKVEKFIMEKKRSLVLENDAVQWQGLVCAVYGSC